jgi:hypothetical protein
MLIMVLVSAIGSTGRRLAALVAVPRGRQADDIAIARWFETYRLTHRVPELPDLSPASAERLAGILSGDDIQAALQELLAARLTDAPETDAAQARGVFCLTLTTTDPDMSRFAQPLVG